MPDDLLQRKKELLRLRLAENGLARGDADNAAPAARADGDTTALSLAQRRLWFVSHSDPADTTLNVGVAYRLEGDLDTDRLRGAFDTLLARHEVLRTTYELGPDGDPIARHHARIATPWQDADISGVAVGSRERRLQVLSRREFGAPFDLRTQPPIRVLLVRVSDTEHVLMITVHHICWDDESWGVFFDEINADYAGSATPTRLVRQYADISDASPDVVTDDVTYWRDQLTPLPEPLGLSAAAPGHVANRQNAIVSRPLPTELSDRIDEFARTHSISPFLVHIATTDVVVHRIAGSTDFTVAVPVTTRPGEADALIGYFGNTLLLRSRPTPTDTFADVVTAASARLIEGITHQHAPVDAVVGAVNPDRSSGPGLAAVASVSVSARRSSSGFALDGVTATQLDGLGLPNGQLPLEFSVVAGQHPSLELEFDTAIFTPDMAAGILDVYLHMIDQAVGSPDTAIRDLDLLDPTARAATLAASTGTQTRHVETTLVALFEQSVAERPDHEAVVSDTAVLTYRSLDQQSNRLAHWMIEAGIGAEDIVGLRLGGSVGFLVAALAVLKAGAAYLPIDPDYPADRVQLLLTDATPRLVLDAAALDDAQERASSYSADAPTDADRRRPLRPGNIAYVIYTSGSTGTPKGVPVEHRAIADHLLSFRSNGVIEPHDRLVQTSSVSFDASMLDIFCTFLAGATLVVPKPHAMHDISYLADLLIRQRVTVMHMVPTVLTTLMMIPEVKQWTMLRTVPVGGEALSGEVADAFTTTFDAALSNNYGPTEAVVAATHFPVDGPQGNRIVPIGTPNDNVTAYLLDAGLRLVPDGVAGEIYLGGTQLARGYLGGAALSASRFVADPFEPGGRLYRTGDLARRTDDGDLDFLGRADEQVKVRGYRIELGEVEAALAQHDDVAHAVALVERADSGARLIAYLIPERHAIGSLDVDTVLDYARTALPDYLVPAAAAVIAEVPLTTHGKLDRAALPAIAVAQQSNRAPSTPTELRIAAIFGELFSRDDVGADSSFFDLGGHSLLAARLVTTLTTEFGIDVDVRLPLDNPTVAGLAAAVNAAVRDEFGIDLDELDEVEDAGLTQPGPASPAVSTATGGGRPPLHPMVRPDVVPLSFSQLAMWFQHRFEGPGAAGNIPLAIGLTGPLDLDALRAAFDDVVERHESLRTSFADSDGLPVAIVADRVELALPVTQVDSDNELDARLSAARGHLFDLDSAPLVRLELLRRNEHDHLLSLVIHHLLVDHWSTGVLITDLIESYRSRIEGRRRDVPAPGLTYTDYALWQHEVFPVGSEPAGDAAEFGRRQIEHWRTTLAGLPDSITVATDRPRPTALTKSGVLCDFSISPQARQRIRRVADDAGATEFMTLTAAMSGLLSRLGGGDDIAIGTPVAGRVDPGTDELIGLFANMVALRTRTDGDPTPRELIARSRETVLGAFANQDVPIERLVEAINPRRTRSRNPLFQSMIHFRDYDPTASGRPLDAAGETTLRMLPVEQDTSFLDLNVIASVTENGGIEGRVVASADLYEQDTVDGIARSLAAMLEAFGTDPDTPLRAITLPPLPGVIGVERHGDDPTILAALIASEHPRRVVAAPRTLAALQHSGSTDFGSVRDWVVTEAGAPATLGETLAALAPGSRLVDQFADAAPVVVAMASTLGGGTETPTEERLVAILGDLLGIDGLGRDDNFFSVGGDSVVSIQLAARAAAEGLPLTPQQVFDYYSIAELAAAVDDVLGSASGGDTTATVEAEDEAAPMSASGLSDDLLGALGAAWKSRQ